ncbi:MAG TPA: hypothetical protein VF506_03710 [Streptosporangiaceae bacterium]
MAADVTAIILTVACAAIAACCAALVRRLWRAGSLGRNASSPSREP